MIAVNGLRRYGFNTEADRITANFLSLILKEFNQNRTIVEKYDVARRESEISSGIKFGYDYNVVGFGWTNAAFTDMYARLPAAKKNDVLNLDGLKVP
jgi:alpha,alpha-trehalase